MNVEPMINARFKKFRESHELASVPDGEAFEKFVNHAILTVHQPDAFTADSELLDFVCVGGEADMGIDGIGIKVNGILVKTTQEIDDLLTKLKRANVEFIFIQSKYKPHFNKGELNNFVDGVRDFLSEEHHFPMNDNVKQVLELKEYLLNDDIVIMWDKNPQVIIYYVAMGKWRNAPDLVGLSTYFTTDLSKLNTFDEAQIHFVDSESLKGICDSIENTFTETINSRQVMPLSDVETVSNSCVALVYADEFLKLLMTPEGVIRKSLFDSNVRDFQGENTVNNEIEETITFDPTKFILLNNGITIVCDEFKQNNTRLTIVNPQIVNGCQTSHVIYNTFKKGIDISNVPVTIKIISTLNLDLSNEIVRGNNRQNIVLEEAFETTKKFHKELEEFFNCISVDYERLYYERRSKQYAHNPTIKQTEKINLRILTQYFLGMFLNKPHVAHRHESILLREFPNDLFQEYHSKLPYFTCALAFYNLERIFRQRLLKNSTAPFKAHLLMMFRESVAGFQPNMFNEKASDEHSKKVLLFLKDQEKTIERFKEIQEIFDNCRVFWEVNLKRDKFRMKDIGDFTDLLLQETRKKYKIIREDINRDQSYLYKGKVVKVSIDRYGKYFGFISRQPDDIFFHSKQNRDLNFTDLKGKIVTYKVSQNIKDGNLYAVEVEID